MPWWARKSEAERPTTPPPIMRTGTCVESVDDMVMSVDELVVWGEKRGGGKGLYLSKAL